MFMFPAFKYSELNFLQNLIRLITQLFCFCFQSNRDLLRSAEKYQNPAGKFRFQQSFEALSTEQATVIRRATAKQCVSSSLAVSTLGVGGDWSWVGRAEFPALFVFHPELRLFIRLEWSVGSVIGPFGSLNYASFYPVLFIWQVTRSKYQVQLQQLFTNWTCRLHYRVP